MLKLHGKNEARVLQDIGRLLVPFVETLASLGDQIFDDLVESVSKGWNNCKILTASRPQPDYAVGLGEYAFPSVLRKKLGSATFDDEYLSPFMATWYMQLPFSRAW